jgi:hypothetical protein
VDAIGSDKLFSTDRSRQIQLGDGSVLFGMNIKPSSSDNPQQSA